MGSRGVDCGPLLRPLFQTEDKIFKELGAYMSQDRKPQATLSIEVLTSLKEKLLSEPQATACVLHQLEATRSTRPSTRTETANQETSISDHKKWKESQSLSQDGQYVGKIFQECLDHCLRRMENLEEKLHKEEEEYSSLLKRQQKSYSPMRSSMGKAKQKTIDSAEASKFKERIVATNMKKLETENLFYKILSLSINVDVDSFSELFPRMLMLSYERKLLAINKIHFSLMSTSRKCLHAFCEKEGEFLLNKFYDKKAELSAGMLPLGPSEVREIFHICARNSKHIMEIIFEKLMNDSLGNIKETEIQEDFVWLMPLWPLIFIQTITSAQGIGDNTGALTLWKKSSSAVDPVLEEVCGLLQRDMRLVHWCLAHNSRIKTQSLLQLVRDHSPLYVIHKALQLNTLVPNDVLQLLQEHCLARDPSGALNSSCKNTYTSFCILSQLFEVIGTGMQLDNISTGWQARRRSRYSSVPGSAEVNSFQERQTHAALYKQCIAEKLKAAQKLLDNLYPLAYRLELMENIYSLLFVRHSDMSDEALSVSSAEESEMEHSFPSQHTDIESLMSVSVSTVLPPHRESCSHAPAAVLQTNDESEKRKKMLEFSEYLELNDRGCEKVNFSTHPSSGSSVLLSKSPSLEGKIDNYASLEQLQCEAQQHSSQSGGAATQRQSSCVSGKSTSSLGELPHTGYLINTLVAWDVMLLLKDSLLVFTAECFKQNKDEGSVSKQGLQTRVSFLSRCVNEGLWRLQVMVPGTHSFGSADIFDDYLDGSLFSHTSHQLVYEVPPLTWDTKKKLGKDQEPSQTRSSSAEHKSVINFLLAPSSSLITLSLANRNVERIEQIFHTYKVPDTTDRREAYLAVKLNQLRPKLSLTCQRLGQARGTKSVSGGSSSRDLLQSIGLLAREGSAQVGATNLIHDLVTSSPPPVPKGIPEAALETDCPVTASFLAAQALVLADLALTVDVTETTAAYIMQQVLQRQSSEYSVPEKGLETGVGIVGYIPIVQQLEAICRAITDFRNPETNDAARPSERPNKENVYLHLSGQPATPFSLLLSPLPLRETEMRKYIYGWSRVLQCVCAAQKAVLQGNVEEVQDTGKSPLNSQNNQIHASYKTLLHTLSAEAPHLYHSSTKDVCSTKLGAYIRSFYQYLQLLSAMVTQYAEKDFLTKMNSYFSLLAQRPVDILGSLMFQEGVDPVRLEPIAARMKLSLTSMILQYCCPKFTIPRENFHCASLPSGRKEKAHALGFMVLKKQVIMNAGSLSCSKSMYGEVVVQGILTTLLSSLHEAIQPSTVVSRTNLKAVVLNDDTAPSFLSAADAQVALRDTADLSAVDFRKMTPGNEATVFFINLANLMFIHAGLLNHILYPRGQCFPEARGIFSDYQLERIFAMKRVGYLVGQLGFVSLYDILYTILPLQNPLSSILVQKESKSRISVCESNLICSKFLPKREEISSTSELLVSVPSKVSFCITQGSPVSPRVQVLFADRLEEQLEEGVLEHARLFFLAEGSKKMKQVSSKPHPFKNSSVDKKCKILTSRTMLDYLAKHPDGMVKGLQALQENMPQEMATVLHEVTSELSKGKHLEVDVLDRNEKKGIVLEIIESFEGENVLKQLPDIDETTYNGKGPSVPPWQCDRVPQSVLAYLRRQCPLLSFIVQVFHQTAELSKRGNKAQIDDSIDYTDSWLNILYPPSLGIKPPAEETKVFRSIKNLFSQSRNRALARLYSNNEVISALSHDPDTSAIWELADSLLGSGSITKGHESQLQQHVVILVGVLQALPTTTQERHPDLSLFLDHLLVFLVQATPATDEPGPWSYACQISDSETRFAVVMETLRQWPASPTLEVLSVISHDPSLPTHLQNRASIRAKQLDLYDKIMKLGGALCESWQEVERMSSEEPARLLQHLGHKKKFKLSVEWANYHSGTAELRRLVDQSYLMDVLDKTTPDYSVAAEALEALTQQDLTVVIQELLHKLSNFSTRRFLMEFYLKRYFSLCPTQKAGQVSDCGGSGDGVPVCGDNTQECDSRAASAAGCHLDVGSLLQEVMGLVLIEAVAPPLFDRFQLSHLVATPHLIIEQWLMNVRLEAIEKAVKVLSPLLDMVDACMSTTTKLPDFSSSSAQNIDDVLNRDPQCLTWNTLNQLLETYGAKALDTTGVQLALKPHSIIEKASKKFVMPAQPPKMQDWVPDAEVRKCPVCEVTIFSMFSRRHHCRRCGRVVCSTCSQHRIIVQGYDGLLVRVCHDCYHQTQDLNLHNYIQVRPLGNGTFDSVTVSTDEESPRGGSTSASDCEGGWYLSTDMHHNDVIRREFCFDYAPSLSLCLAILAHHSDHMNAALCIIKLCHHLFSLIISSLRLMSPTVDHTFVLSMIQTLLASSKVRFGNISKHQGIGLCEYYTQWVDLLSLLLKSNCGHIIPHEALENMLVVGELRQKTLLKQGDVRIALDKHLKQEFLYMRRLRDMLVKKQMWELALDISTKIGLEAAGVWGAWAMASLKAGDFPGARERFSRVLERPADKNRQCKSSLLPEVIKYLESNPFQVNQQVMDQAQRARSSIMLSDHNKLSPSQALVVLHSLQNLHRIAEGSLTSKDTFQRQSFYNIKQKRAGKSKIEPVFQVECKYYLSLYGNHSMALQFFRRHRQVQDCVEYLLQESIDREIFIEDVLIPFLRCGQLGHLMSSLFASDPHMERWGKLILGSCRWMERRGWWNCLLSVQEAMGDRLRASMTLLRMYTDGAASYTALSNRSDFVTSALTHLQAHLDQQALMTSTPKRKVIILNMSAWQVNQNINMLNLQADVTKFLATCEAAGSDVPALIRILINLHILKNKDLPTLLTNDSGRLGVAILVVCVAEVVADGLNLAYRIVERTQLSVEKLLSGCCEVLVKRESLSKVGLAVRGIQEWDILTPEAVDSALRPALMAVAATNNTAYLEALIKLLSSDTAKMEAFIQCRRLKSAYLVAVHRGSRQGVERVQEEAVRRGQAHVAAMCTKWLKNYHS